LLTGDVFSAMLIWAGVLTFLLLLTILFICCSADTLLEALRDEYVREYQHIKRTPEADDSYTTPAFARVDSKDFIFPRMSVSSRDLLSGATTSVSSRPNTVPTPYVPTPYTLPDAHEINYHFETPHLALPVITVNGSDHDTRF
jgi:hypothetical protein